MTPPSGHELIKQHKMLNENDSLPEISVRPASPIQEKVSVNREKYMANQFSQWLLIASQLNEDFSLSSVDEACENALDADTLRVEVQLLRALMNTEKEVSNGSYNKKPIAAIDRILEDIAIALPQELILLYSASRASDDLYVLGSTMKKLHGTIISLKSTVSGCSALNTKKEVYFDLDIRSHAKYNSTTDIDAISSYTSKAAYSIPIFGPGRQVLAILEVRSSHDSERMWIDIRRYLLVVASTLSRILQCTCRESIRVMAHGTVMANGYNAILDQCTDGNWNYFDMLAKVSHMMVAEHGAYFKIIEITDTSCTLQQEMIYKHGLPIKIEIRKLNPLDQGSKMLRWLRYFKGSILQDIDTNETSMFLNCIGVPDTHNMIAMRVRNPRGDDGIFCFFKLHISFDPNAISAASSVQKLFNMPTEVHINKTEITSRLSAMHRMIMTASKARTGSDFISAITNMGCNVFGTERITLYMFDQIRQELWCLSTHGDVNGIRLPLGTGIAGRVAADKKMIVLNDAYSDPRFDQSVDKYTGFRTRSMIALPILNEHGNLIGVIQAINRVETKQNLKPTFVDDDIDLLKLFCVELKSLITEKRSILRLTKTFVDMNVAGTLPAGETDKKLEAQLLNVKSINSLLQESSQYREHRSAAKGSLPYVVLAVGKFNRILKKHKRIRARCGSFISSKIDDASTEVLFNSELTNSINGEFFMEGCDMRDLSDLGFDPFSKSKEQLRWYITGMFEALGLLSYFRVEFECVTHFVTQLLKSYRDNPYHNSRHGFSVMHVVYTLIRRSPIRNIISSLDIFGVLIAALGHDADHPGHDNQTEILAYSELSITYNDISVLENHHAAITFSILRGMNYSLLEALSIPAQRQIRATIVSCILATDMKHHSDLLKQLSEKPMLEDYTDETADRQLLLNVMVHSADLSGQALPLEISLQWTSRICEEFQRQEVIFRDNNWHVPPHMVNLQDYETRIRLQLNFIDYLVSPLWESLGSILTGADEFLKHLQINRAYFQEKVNESVVIAPE